MSVNIDTIHGSYGVGLDRDPLVGSYLKSIRIPSSLLKILEVSCLYILINRPCIIPSRYIVYYRHDFLLGPCFLFNMNPRKCGCCFFFGFFPVKRGKFRLNNLSHPTTTASPETPVPCSMQCHSAWCATSPWRSSASAMGARQMSGMVLLVSSADLIYAVFCWGLRGYNLPETLLFLSCSFFVVVMEGLVRP